MKPVLTTIAAAGPEFLYYPVFVAVGGFVTAQIRDVAGLEDVKIAGSDGIFTADLLKGGGREHRGHVSLQPGFQRLHRRLCRLSLRNTKPNMAVQHSPPSMLMRMMLPTSFLRHLEKVAVVEADGTIYVPRQALRDAIYATKDFKGITGNLSCSAIW